MGELPLVLKAEGCSLIKKLVKLTCAKVLDLFWWPRGILEAEYSDLQQRLWGCNRLDSAILQKGSEASSRFFKGRRLPIQDWVKPDFLIKNHTKRPEDTTSAFINF